MKEIILNSEEETIELGKEIASQLSKGDVVVLSRWIRFWQNEIDRRHFDVFWFAKWDFEPDFHHCEWVSNRAIPDLSFGCLSPRRSWWIFGNWWGWIFRERRQHYRVGRNDRRYFAFAVYQNYFFKRFSKWK